MSATIDTWTGGLGLLAGFCAVAAWLLLAGRPADIPAPSASMRLGTLATGELGVAPLSRPVLATTDLRPGRPGESGTVRIRNQTATRLAVSVRTSAVQRELDGTAWIELAERGDTLLRTRLGRTRSWTPTELSLAPGETRKLRARAWIPADAPDGWQAARAELTLELRGRVKPR